MIEVIVFVIGWFSLIGLVVWQLRMREHERAAWMSLLQGERQEANLREQKYLDRIMAKDYSEFATMAPLRTYGDAKREPLRSFYTDEDEAAEIERRRRQTSGGS